VLWLASLGSRGLKDDRYCQTFKTVALTVQGSRNRNHSYTLVGMQYSKEIASSATEWQIIKSIPLIDTLVQCPSGNRNPTQTTQCSCQAGLAGRNGQSA
jgi:hypothetical protein